MSAALRSLDSKSRSAGQDLLTKLGAMPPPPTAPIAAAAAAASGPRIISKSVSASAGSDAAGAENLLKAGFEYRSRFMALLYVW